MLSKTQIIFIFFFLFSAYWLYSLDLPLHGYRMAAAVPHIIFVHIKVQRLKTAYPFSVSFLRMKNTFLGFHNRLIVAFVDQNCIIFFFLKH